MAAVNPALGQTPDRPSQPATPADTTVAHPAPAIRDSVGRAPVALDAVRVVAAPSQRGYAGVRSTSAMKTDTPLRDTPQAVSVVTRALIADQAMQNMADAVRYIPGVTMGQGEGHRDAPTIRGTSTTADFFVDGVRDDAQYLRDVYNVERIEAIKGPNAMVFGRGGGGGVINRVSKEAGPEQLRDFGVAGGAYDQRRLTADVDRTIVDRLDGRLNAMYERSGSFRDQVGLERFGINPTLALTAGARTSARLSWEHFSDRRTVDRGIPSFRGAPSAAPIAEFFGAPSLNRARAAVDAGRLTAMHTTARGVEIRNAARFARYDKFYRNVYPGAVVANGDSVTLAGYSNATDRVNLFDQLDVTWRAVTGAVRHTLVGGSELGMQRTTNFRRTASFASGRTTVVVPFADPVVREPVVFAQSATDADNRVSTLTTAAYLQDQLALSRRWQAVVGARYERFDLHFHNNRNGAELARTDAMLSPRAGLTFKPGEPMTIYTSYSVSHLPSAGDQFSSLNATTQTLEPERFTNYEVGAKWEPARTLSLTAAVFRLDRTNTAARDPNDASRTVQTGAQRTVGGEVGISGAPTTRWQIAGGYGVQRATIVARTTAAAAGATVPLVPRMTASLWNRYEISSALGAGVGIVRQERSYAAIDNSVTLPAFTRVDAALFIGGYARLRAQVNVENALNVRYYPTSQGNNNIMPGAPRTLRLSLTSSY